MHPISLFLWTYSFNDGFVLFLLRFGAADIGNFKHIKNKDEDRNTKNQSPDSKEMLSQNKDKECVKRRQMGFG